MKHCATSITERRLKLSASAPDTSENSMIGRVVEAWTSATRSAEVEIEVIIQAAPTPWISEPKLEASVANHTLRNVWNSKGASAVGRAGAGSSGMPLWPGPARWRSRNAVRCVENTIPASAGLRNVHLRIDPKQTRRIVRRAPIARNAG